MIETSAYVIVVVDKIMIRLDGGHTLWVSRSEKFETKDVNKLIFEVRQLAGVAHHCDEPTGELITWPELVLYGLI